jgi:acetyltransferase (GNAT) family protein
MNVALRPLDGGDVEWLDGWLGAVAASVGYELDAEPPSSSLQRRRAHERHFRVDVIERDGRAAGVALYRTRAPRRDAAIIELVATPPSEARRGTGMAAAALVEELLRARGVRAVYAPAPAVHGIDVYFWIRLGYRPLRRDAWPCAIDGVAWMQRDLSL